MVIDLKKAQNKETCAAWNTNAQVWDASMGNDGNAFHRVLVRPATERLLEVLGNRIFAVGLILAKFHPF